MKLNFNYSDVLNGNFTLGPLNLMMVFQMNCPGCFIHGFPLLKELQRYYGETISCFALATAFEDFDVNTLENVKLLVSEGKLVGETLKAQKAGVLHWNNELLSFTILMDEISPSSELQEPGAVQAMLENISASDTTTAEQESMIIAIRDYFNQMPLCGKTFATNLMRGTPSFFLFDQSLEIIIQWFGHAEVDAVKRELNKFITDTASQRTAMRFH